MELLPYILLMSRPKNDVTKQIKRIKSLGDSFLEFYDQDDEMVKIAKAVRNALKMYYRQDFEKQEGYDVVAHE